MPPRDAVIDLDLLPAEEPPPPPVNPRSRRRLLTAAALALVAFLLGGAVPTSSRRAVTLFETALPVSANFEIVGDTCYVTEPLREGSRVTAYPLAGGRPRWVTQLAATSGELALQALGDVLLVSSITSEPLVITHVTALDRRTGAIRWESPLWASGLDVTHNRVVVGNPVRADRIDAMPDGDVVAVAADTGAARWTYHWAAGCQVDVPQTPDDARAALAVLCGDGTLSAVDLDSGRVRATVGDAVRRPENSLGFGIGVFALADRILVNYPFAGSSVIASFDPVGLARQWTVTLPLDNYYISDCGLRLCLFSSPGTRILERATGREVWREPAGSATVAVTDQYLLTFLASGAYRVTDARNGRIVLALDGWVLQLTEEGLLAFRQEPATDRTWVASVLTDPVELRLLGFLPGMYVGQDCGRREGYLACRTVNQTLEVWRWPGSGR